MQRRFKNWLDKGGVSHFYFIDQYIDVFNYNEPIRKYFYRIENIIEKNAYTTNHLNFNPSLLVTHNGVVFDKIEEQISYVYDRNDAFVGQEAENVFMGYYLWLNNRMQFFERTYKRLQDVFSDIGGISKFITFVAIFINQFYNNYIIFYDTKVLLTTSLNTKDNQNENENNKYRIELNNIESSPHNYETNKSFDRVRVSKECIVSNTNLNNIEQNRKINITNNNININSENEKTREEIEENNNQYDNKDININENDSKRKKFSFWNYFVYKICLGKKNSKLKIYEDFRTKIMSEEQLIKNHLNIYNLLKESEISEINKNHRNELKDLIKKGTIIIWLIDILM